jgi:hypothetical protein
MNVRTTANWNSALRMPRAWLRKPCHCALVRRPAQLFFSASYGNRPGLLVAIVNQLPVIARSR